MTRIASTLLACTFLAGSALAAKAEVNVVTSIKPVHSLVAAVMEGVGTPGLIVEGAGSPHTYAMKPSQARMLERADVVFWVGEKLETFLAKPLGSIAADAKTVALIDAHGLVRLDFREGGAFEGHDHGDHDGHGDHDDHAEKGHDDHAHDGHAHDEHDHDKHAHDDHGHSEHSHDEHGHEDHAKAGHEGHDHDSHDHDAHKKHDHDEHAHDEHGHDEHGHEGHAHGGVDPHIWLDPANAKAMVAEIAEALSEADPGNADSYAANAKKVAARLDTLTAEVKETLAPVGDRGFVVFHDAYRYFEARFGVTAVGSITVSPEVMPGAERISEIRHKLEDVGATCVFAEPQFEPKLVDTVIEGTQARAGTIDPLGAGLADGPELYFTLIRQMAASIKTCLSAAS